MPFDIEQRQLGPKPKMTASGREHTRHEPKMMKACTMHPFFHPRDPLQDYVRSGHGIP